MFFRTPELTIISHTPEQIFAVESEKNGNRNFVVVFQSTAYSHEFSRQEIEIME